MLFLIMVVGFLFYCFKGILISHPYTFVLKLIVLILGVLAINMSLGYFENPLLKIIFIGYFCCALLEYFIGNLKTTLPSLYFMSKIHIVSPDIKIKYQIFKPFLLFIVNIFMFFKRKIFLRLRDTFEINIKTSSNVKINIIF